MKKHGVYKADNPQGLEYDFTHEFYWMGEKIELADFNERLMAQFKSAARDLDWMLKGMELKDGLNEGEKTVAQLDEVEKIAKLPLCKDCRKLIGELQ